MLYPWHSVVKATLIINSYFQRLNFFLRLVLGQFCFMCAYLQFKHHSGLLAQAEADRSVLSDSDSRGGEPGASRSAQSRPHLGEREGSGSEQRTENSHAPGELLHGANRCVSHSLSFFHGSVNKFVNLTQLGSR